MKGGQYEAIVLRVADRAMRGEGAAQETQRSPAGAQLAASAAGQVVTLDGGHGGLGPIEIPVGEGPAEGVEAGVETAGQDIGQVGAGTR